MNKQFFQALGFLAPFSVPLVFVGARFQQGQFIGFVICWIIALLTCRSVDHLSCNLEYRLSRKIYRAAGAFGLMYYSLYPLAISALLAQAHIPVWFPAVSITLALALVRFRLVGKTAYLVAAIQGVSLIAFVVANLWGLPLPHTFNIPFSLTNTSHQAAVMTLLFSGLGYGQLTASQPTHKSYPAVIVQGLCALILFSVALIVPISLTHPLVQLSLLIGLTQSFASSIDGQRHLWHTHLHVPSNLFLWLSAAGYAAGLISLVVPQMQIAIIGVATITSLFCHFCVLWIDETAYSTLGAGLVAAMSAVYLQGFRLF